MPICSQCKEEKDISEFYRTKREKSGYHCYCKVCSRKYDNKKYYKNHELYLEKNRQYYRNNKEKWVERNNKAKERYPEKDKAREIFRNALNSGKINKLPCGVCGSDKSDGHHTDYSKPLDVVWLCRKHHMELHRRIDMSLIDTVKDFEKQNIYGNVVKISIDDKVLGEYKSISEAAKSVGKSYYSIYNVVKGKSKSSAGYKWKYKNI